MKSHGILLSLLITLFSYAQKEQSMPHSNALAKETSPYLLQHAQNPVDWYPWGDEALEKARRENKLLLISIGYAACHWCHVMEAECFEDEEVADMMNTSFVNIKVDREERPDIDHIYMDALQMLTGRGGWPLNVVALPDGRPFWGATYVQKDSWLRALDQLATLYHKNPKKVRNYAEDLSKGLQAINLIEAPERKSAISLGELEDVVNGWSRHFDPKMGGYNRAPKFMLPGNLDFLLHYAELTGDLKIEAYVDLSLTQMAYGGVFDQLGGGFARYSVDDKWHVPHFEKMLYDNGLLTSLYAKAYAVNRNPLYAEVVSMNINFIQSELMSSEFGFYSSLDADSLDSEGELEEGAYYVWTKDELHRVLGGQYELFAAVYNINSYGHWEKGNYVLIRDKAYMDIAEEFGIELTSLMKQLDVFRELLMTERAKRSRPRLDDKILCSWNGLMLKGLVDAYRYLKKPEYLELAVQNANFIKRAFVKEDGSLYHSYKEGQRSINGYLEDYSSVIDAFIGLYEVSQQENWLLQAKDLLDVCMEDYFDQETALFYFSSGKDPYVIRRTLETGDNVIPASNSMMAQNLFRMSRYFPEYNYANVAGGMVARMRDRMLKNPGNHANWLHMVLYQQFNFYEVAIAGPKAEDYATEIGSNYLPQTIMAAAETSSSLPLLDGKITNSETLIYICEYGSCKMPVTTPAEALDTLLNRSKK